MKKPKAQARFFFDSNSQVNVGDRISLDQETCHKIFNVLRFSINDQIELIHKTSFEAFLAKIINPPSVEIVKKIAEVQNKQANIAFLALAKSETNDLLCQKLTEIGVNKIIFFESARSIVKIKNLNIADRTKRFIKIATAAAQQSLQTKIPEVHLEKNLEDAISKYNIKNDLNLIALQGSHSLLDQDLSSNSILNINITFGPEGGLSENEIQFLSDSGFKKISLGQNVLRVETAAILGLGLLNLMINKQY